MDAAAPIEEFRFPCHACGSDFRFDPTRGRLNCDHCGATAEIDPPTRSELRQALAERDLDAMARGDFQGIEVETTRTVSCDSCGAQVSFAGAEQSKECPFCASPVVTDTGEHRHIKPAALLPFSVEETDARAAMTKWLGRLWFAPNGLQEYARKGRRMQGIYVPYWTFDADTRSRYTGQRGDAYWVTETRMRNGKQEQVRVQKIRWTPVSGRVARQFDDVLVLASQSLPRSYTEALEPWDLGGLTPYKPDYLAGLRAEGYTVDLREGHDRGRQKMARVIETDVRRDIGGDQQRVQGIDTAFGGETFKHILLPVWLAAYKFRGNSYRFVVNGRTGEVAGERPYSPMKIAAAVVLALLLIGAALYLANDPPQDRAPDEPLPQVQIGE